MLLHKNKEVFRQVLSATADDLGLESFQVEKDYYVSMFLEKLAKIESNIKIVFKGGTSLSKCYSIIDRFSEDIDLAVKFNNNKVTQGERKKLKKHILEIIKMLDMKFLNEDEVKSGRDHNEYHVAYDNLFKADTEMVPHIIVETIVVYRPYPCEQMAVSNYVTKYLEENNRTELVKKYNLEPFEMMIQTVERTFVDKLFAICDYHLDSKYNRYSRHIYDIHMIWGSGKLDKDLMKEIIPKVVRDRQLFGKNNKSCNPSANPNDVLKEIVNKNVYKDDYDNVTSRFIYKMVDYETCIRSLKEIIELNIIPNKIQEY